MKLLKQVWEIIKRLFLRKRKMKLPTIKNPLPPPQDLIDKAKIPHVFIWIGNDGATYIGIELDGFLYKLNWSLDLEFWISLSGIRIIWLPGAPCELEFAVSENTLNIPYDLPPPHSANFVASKRP